MRVMSIFQHLSAPPAFDDESKTRLAALLHRITLGLAGLAVLYMVISSLVAYTALALLFGFLVFAICLLLNRLSYRGQVRAASLGLASGLWITFTLAAIFGSGFGVFDTSFTGYMLPIMIAGFLLGGRMGMFFALLSAGAGLVILVLDPNTGTPPFSLSRSLAQWVGQGVFFIAAAYLLALSRRSLLERNSALRQEVAERQRIEKILREQRERLVIAFRAGGLAGWILNGRTGQLIYPDADPEDSATYSRNLEAFLEQIHPDDVQAVRTAVETSLRDKVGFELEYRHLPTNGALEWYYTRAEIYDDQERDFAGLYGLTYNITQRRQAEEAVRASEAAARAFQERLKALHEVSIELAQAATLDELYRQTIVLGRDKLGFSRLGLFLMDDDPKLVTGTYGIDMQGELRDEHALRVVLGNNKMVMDALHNHLHVSVQDDIELWDNATVVGRGWNAMALLWDETEAIGWLAADNLLDGEPIRHDQLELLSLYGSFLGPIILKKQAEMESQRHQDRLRLALKAAQMRTWHWDMRTSEIVTDEPEKFGLRTATRIEDFYRQVHPDDHVFIQAALARAVTENLPYVAEYRVLAPKGQIRWIYSLGQVHRDETGQATNLTGVSQDITTRKQAEERFYKAFHANPSAIAITTFATGRYIEVNEAWLRLMGYTREETIGHTSVELGFIDSEETRARLLHRFQEQGFLRDEELLAGGQGGRKIPVLLLAEQIELDGEVCFLTMLQDISGRHEAEKQALELALQRERVALLTEFMGNMSHDIKTPLTAINTNLYLLERASDPAKQQARLDAIRLQTRLLEKFIQDILTISRLDYVPGLDLQPARLNALLGEIETRLRPLVEQKNLSFTLELEPDDPLILGDMSELDRVMVNLMENATNYTPAGGAVRVRSVRRDRFVAVEVIDTGIGIERADISRIFSRFYRASAARSAHHDGTGLGLAIVQKIVEMHNGSIEIESEPGKGSTFRVLLPLAESAAS